MTIDAVVFDIGNVLVQWQPEAAFDRLIGEAKRRALFAAVDLDTMNQRVDLGDKIADVVAECAVEHPEWREEVLIWNTHWAEMFQPVIPGSVRLLRALRTRGVPVLALSNFGASTFDLAQTMYPFLTEFDQLYVSGRLRMMKPDPAIYAALEAGCGYAPERLFFIDDRPNNIAAAEARGWRGHLFEGPEGLAERLVAEGLLSAAEAAA